MSDRSETSAANSDTEAIEQQLRDERPRPTGEQLERARRISLSSSRRPAKRSALLGFRPGMARLAMVSLISGAFLVAGSSATLAVSGISGDGSAGTAQYRAPDGGGILPSGDEGEDPGPDVLGELDPGGVPTEETEPVADDPAAADPERQVASAGDDVLPFTGLAVLPLLVLGCALLVSGFVLRHRVRTDGSAG